MKARIEVTSKAEGERIRRAMERPDVRAFVNIMGALFIKASR
jgi:hypothetical protein